MTLDDTTQEVAEKLEDSFEDEFERFLDSFIKNKARPAFMMYMRDWFDEKVEPVLRERCEGIGDVEQFKDELYGVTENLDQLLNRGAKSLTNKDEMLTSSEEDDLVCDIDELSENAVLMQSIFQFYRYGVNFSYPTKKQLIEMSGLRKSTMYRAIQELQNREWLEKVDVDYDKKPENVAPNTKKHVTLKHVPFEKVNQIFRDKYEEEIERSDVLPVESPVGLGDVSIEEYLKEIKNLEEEVKASPFEVREAAKERLDAFLEDIDT